MQYPPPRPFSDVVPRIDGTGRSLLEKMLAYDPLQRCSAADAMKHEYFNANIASKV